MKQYRLMAVKEQWVFIARNGDKKEYGNENLALIRILVQDLASENGVWKSWPVQRRQRGTKNGDKQSIWFLIHVQNSRTSFFELFIICQDEWKLFETVLRKGKSITLIYCHSNALLLHQCCVSQTEQAYSPGHIPSSHPRTLPCSHTAICIPGLRNYMDYTDQGCKWLYGCRAKSVDASLECGQDCNNNNNNNKHICIAQ